MELSTAEQTDFRAAHRSAVSDRNFRRNTSVYRRDCGLIQLILLRTNVQLRGRNCDCIYVGSRSLTSLTRFRHLFMTYQRSRISRWIISNICCRY